MFFDLFKKTPSKPSAPPKTPDSTRIYAIGDIHGRADLLEKMHALITEDANNCPPETRKILVYMGDYVDRGTGSKQVVDTLLHSTPDGFDTVFLKGNHEYAMLLFIENPQQASSWLSWGGTATIQSYGGKMHHNDGKRLSVSEQADSLLQNIPDEHMNFFEHLKQYHIEGDYLFVHAGLRPGVPLENQTPEDMMMIREEFILSEYIFDKTVVFGHTIFEEPLVKAGRIGIDTGAYAYGKLTCVVLEGEHSRFLYAR